MTVPYSTAKKFLNWLNHGSNEKIKRLCEYELTPGEEINLTQVYFPNKELEFTTGDLFLAFLAGMDADT